MGEDIGNSEILSNQLEAAKNAAMEKVVDINSRNLIKHAFVRFDQAFQFEHPLAPEIEQQNSGIDRLDGIIRAGIVARDFAKRANIPISSNWNDPNNETHISLFSKNTTVEDAITAVGPNIPVLIKAKVDGTPYPQIPAEDLFLLLLDGNLRRDTKDIPQNLPWAINEQNYKRRLKPSQIKGIIILDDLTIFDPIITPLFNPQNLNPEQSIHEVLKKMEKYYGSQINKYFPIYGNSGSLYWPQKMTYKDLQKYLAQKHQD